MQTTNQPHRSPVRHRGQPSHGIGLLDVLIALAIVGLLLNLTLPAVQSARSAARRVACANNLRQVGLAMQMHHDTHGCFPANGWGYRWVGDPDRGYGREQPGGWIYNTLAFTEQRAVREKPAGMPAMSPEKKQATARMLSTVLAGWNCPERRVPALYATNDPYSPHNSETVYAAARADFAANGGSDHCLIISKTPISSAGPESVQQFEAAHWTEEFKRLRKICNGIVAPASSFAYRHITDGASQTYLVGEKSIHSEHYLDGRAGGDKYSLHTGANNEATRLGLERPRPDAADASGHGSWGSAHPGGVNMVYCSGALRCVSFEVDAEVHRAASNRHDGLAVLGDD